MNNDEINKSEIDYLIPTDVDGETSEIKGEFEVAGAPDPRAHSNWLLEPLKLGIDIERQAEEALKRHERDRSDLQDHDTKQAQTQVAEVKIDLAPKV